MQELAIIICGMNKPCKWIKPIKRYIPIDAENKQYFFNDTILIEELDNSIHAVKQSDLCYADLEKSNGKVGDNYRISNEYINYNVRGLANED